ncbi:hypothetical protein FNF29_05042 [Cafeteria roenbergensis]|uniref:Inositol polyphosphate-related phosphatase domain-containing protein n=1 Tax=Cafeteria roenbergensis TaxID=33653 RepID=A0A5A8CCN7_CAFRO|nr:hypothetical protein FNF29_05042 [Cafeteria roenbergensis]|eukprot:KAA0150705.1 hypothetical protein FNF29_05042 [Cafeteria roenbergensis]
MASVPSGGAAPGGASAGGFSAPRVRKFSVIKRNMFGRHQSRLYEVVDSGEDSGVSVSASHRLRIYTGDARPKLKRDLEATSVIALEPVETGLSDAEAARALTLRFAAELGEARRLTLFSTKGERDEFVKCLLSVNPRCKVGTLLEHAMGQHTSARSGAEGAASALRRMGLDPSAPGVHLVRMENDWGEMEQRVTELAVEEMALRLRNGPGRPEGADSLSLRLLRQVRCHCIDRRVASLGFSGDRVTRKPAQSVILRFATEEERDQMVEDIMATVRDSPGLSSKPEISRDWADGLPTRHWAKFSAVETTAGRSTRVFLLVGPSQRRICIVLASEAGELDGSLLNDVPINSSIGVIPGRLLLDCVPDSARVRIATPAPLEAPDLRGGRVFEFRSAAERARFCAWAQATAAPRAGEAPLSSAIAPSREAAFSGSSIASARASALSGGSFSGSASPGSTGRPDVVLDATDQAVLAADAFGRSSATVPTPADLAVLWRSEWPHDDRRVFVGTFNASSCPPPSQEDLGEWIPNMLAESTRFDLVAIGMQELGPSSNREAWGRALLGYLNAEPRTRSLSFSSAAAAARASERHKSDEFHQVAHVFMWELGLWVFVRASAAADITRVVSGVEATGISLAKGVTGRQLGNKGAVGVGLRWREVPIAFVNCHLAARPDRVVEREGDFTQIVRRLSLDTASSPARTGLDFLHSHEHVFFFGDVNYRVELPFEQAVELHEQGRFDELVARDQLRAQQAMRRVFVDFQEGRIDFGPTYRWDRKQAVFSNKRAQCPSYTDRVLHRSAPGVEWCLRCTGYDSAPSMYGSDHRAVCASFGLKLRQYYAIHAPPRRHPVVPRPSFFASGDEALMPTPVFLVTGLRVRGFQAILAPRTMFLSMHGERLELGSYRTPTMAASGLTQQQTEQLKALRAALKLEARDRKGKKKLAKGDKHAKAGAPVAAGEAAAGDAASSGAGEGDETIPDLDGDEDDMEGEDDDGVLGDAPEASVVTSETGEGADLMRGEGEALAHITVQSCGAGDASTPVDAQRAALLAVVCAFEFDSPRAPAGPSTAAHLLAQAAGPPSASSAGASPAAARGDTADAAAAAAAAATAGSESESGSAARAAASPAGTELSAEGLEIGSGAEAAASAAGPQDEPSDVGIDDDADDVDALCRGIIMRPTVWDPRLLRASAVNFVARSPPEREGGRLPVIGNASLPLSPLCEAASSMLAVGQMQAASQHRHRVKGLRDGSASIGKAGRAARRSVAMVSTYRSLFDDRGIPWSMQAPALPFCVDLLSGGQPVAKLEGRIALRASNDPIILARSDTGVVGRHWDFSSKIASLDDRVREAEHAAEVERAERAELASAKAGLGEGRDRRLSSASTASSTDGGDDFVVGRDAWRTSAPGDDDAVALAAAAALGVALEPSIGECDADGAGLDGVGVGGASADSPPGAGQILGGRMLGVRDRGSSASSDDDGAYDTGTAGESGAVLAGDDRAGAGRGTKNRRASEPAALGIALDRASPRGLAVMAPETSFLSAIVEGDGDDGQLDDAPGSPATSADPPR